MKRAVLVSLVLLAVLAAPVGASVYSHHAIGQRAAAGLDEAQFQRFLDDQKALTTSGTLPRRGGSRDAGVVLNPFMGLDSGTDEERKPEVAAWWATAEVTGALKCPGAPASEGPRYLQCVDTLPTGDLAFLDSLHAYDTWNPASSGAWARYLAAHPAVIAPEAALPNYVPLQALAKLRIADGLRRGDPLPALSDVHQLGLLTWTAESLVGQAVALNILKAEREGYEAAVARGLLPAEAWHPLPEEERLRYQRVLFTTMSIYQGLGPPDARRRLLEAVPEPIGMCAAVDEAMITAPMIRALYGAPWPGEVDLRGTIEGIDATLAGDRCALPVARAIWAAPERDLELLDAGGQDERWITLWLHVPWARQVVGGILLGIATPDFNRYDEAR